MACPRSSCVVRFFLSFRGTKANVWEPILYIVLPIRSLLSPQRSMDRMDEQTICEERSSGTHFTLLQWFIGVERYPQIPAANPMMYGMRQWQHTYMNGHGNDASLSNIIEMIREKYLPNIHDRGIWASSIPLTSLFLWRLHWRRLPAFDKLETCGTTITNECALAGNRVKSLIIFFKHVTTQMANFAAQGSNLICGIVVPSNSSTFKSGAKDLCSITMGSATWELQQTTINVFFWEGEELVMQEGESNAKLKISSFDRL